LSFFFNPIDGMPKPRKKMLNYEDPASKKNAKTASNFYLLNAYSYIKVACGNRTASSIVARNEVTACFTHWPYLLFLVFAILSL
jgi:hypothetical protein